MVKDLKLRTSLFGTEQYSCLLLIESVEEKLRGTTDLLQKLV